MSFLLAMQFQIIGVQVVELNPNSKQSDFRLSRNGSKPREIRLNFLMQLYPKPEGGGLFGRKRFPTTHLITYIYYSLLISLEDMRVRRVTFLLLKLIPPTQHKKIVITILLSSVLD